MKTRFLSLLLTAALCLGLLGCGARTGGSASAGETENLIKLCKVWGYVKYRHPVFLQGKKDWDEELLTLIPQVREAESAGAVNTLLHDWFIGLGEIDYGTDQTNLSWAQAKEEDKVFAADIAWASDRDYLGEELAGDLARIEVLPAGNRTKSPARIGSVAAHRGFANEPEHEARYDNAEFRLLALFRLWNAVEYFFPYLDLMDQEWDGLLREYIPQMLSGIDQDSYEKTLAFLAYQLHDPHVALGCLVPGMSTLNPLPYAANYYLFPAALREAEGKLAVTTTVDPCALKQGDVVLAVNGRKTEALLEDRKLDECTPREDSALNQMRYTITGSREEFNEITVLRDGQELTVSVQYGTARPAELWEPKCVYQILDGNIGLLNPGFPGQEDAEEVMAALWNTSGLIIDLRQYPASNVLTDLNRYVLKEYSPVFVVATPADAYPGAYIKNKTYGGQISGLSQYYDKPVVLLMCNDTTVSWAETEVAILSRGEKVVTMGEHSAGGNGTVALLPLPGKLAMSFSSQGVYTPEGERTQRTGITPDIPVAPTVQGIKEGRDEVLEAAIEYIKANGGQ